MKFSWFEWLRGGVYGFDGYEMASMVEMVMRRFPWLKWLLGGLHGLNGYEEVSMV